MTSKQRAFLKSLSNTLDPLFMVGKSSLTPEFTQSVLEAFNTHELIKLSVLKNCPDDPKELAIMIAERTKSEVVQVIGRKIVLYKPNPDFKKRKYETSKAETKDGKPSKGFKSKNHNVEIAGAKKKASRSGMSLRFVEEADEDFDNDTEE